MAWTNAQWLERFGIHELSVDIEWDRPYVGAVFEWMSNGGCLAYICPVPCVCIFILWLPRSIRHR
jgi:hypothetical protein